MKKKIEFYAFTCSLIINFLIFIILGWCWAPPKEKTARTTIEVQLISRPLPITPKVVRREVVEKKTAVLPPKKEKLVQVKKQLKSKVDEFKELRSFNPSTQRIFPQTKAEKIINKSNKSQSDGSGGVKGLTKQDNGDISLDRGNGGSSGQGKADSQGDRDQDKESSEKTIANIGDPGVVSPDYEYTTKPSYPMEARKEGLEGRVKVRVLVESNGKVGLVRIVKSSGHTILDQEAIRAVQKWRFRPAKRNGSNIACWVDIPLSFKLQ